MQKEFKNSFTITEALVMLTIIIIITGFIVTGLLDPQKSARDKKRLIDLGSYEVALQEYYNKYHSYPYPILEEGETEKEACLRYSPICVYDNGEEPDDCKEPEECELPEGCEEGEEGCDLPPGCEECINDKSDDFCLCEVSSFLSILKEEEFIHSLPQDPIYPKEIYAYASYKNGQGFKLVAKLEKNIEDIKNDGGTSDTEYEVFSTIGQFLEIDYSKIRFINLTSTP